jgi:hypothetical protein
MAGPYIFNRSHGSSVTPRNRKKEVTPMSDAKLEEVLEEVKALPLDEKEQVRDFLKTLVGEGTASGIIKKAIDLMPEERRRLVDALNNAPIESAGPETKAELIDKIMGKYAHILTSSDAFAALKAEEIALEDRRRQS